MSNYNGAGLISILHPEAGLKLDGTVVLGRDEIAAFILSNPETFANVELESWQGSQVLFGVNDLGQHFKVDIKEGSIRRIVASSKKTKKKRLMLVISYDGADFYGFQSQKQERSVQTELETIISRINGETTSVQGASRTDAGVHARHQVIHFDTALDLGCERWVYILNRQLPKDIHVKSATSAPPLFHSRYDAYKKTYRYIINTGEYDPLTRKYEACFTGIDLALLETNLEQLVGTHDFTSFCSGDKEDKTRTIFAVHMEIQSTRIELYFTGNGFLHHMIRLIVAQLVLIATGQTKISIKDIIEERSRASTRKLAPASGLYLENINY